MFSNLLAVVDFSESVAICAIVLKVRVAIFADTKDRRATSTGCEKPWRCATGKTSAQSEILPIFRKEGVLRAVSMR